MPEDAPVGPRHRWLLLGVTVGVVLVLDQLTKWWAVERLAPSAERPLGDTIDLVGSLRFNYAENTGMAFSKGAESGRWIGLLVMAIVAVLVVVGARARTRAQVLLVGVVIGGALGNLVDRVFRAEDGLLSGAVVDFIDLQWWPVFNVADVGVVVGALLLVGASLLPEPDEPDEPDGSGEAGAAGVDDRERPDGGPATGAAEG